MSENEIHFSRLLLITLREKPSYSVTTTSKSLYKQNWNYQRENNKGIFNQYLFSFDSWLWRTCVKKWAYCQRQSFLLSDWFPSMLNRWRTKITSISTKRTYQSINVPVASFLVKSQPVFELEKNCRKRRITRHQWGKTAFPAKLQSSGKLHVKIYIDRWDKMTRKNT